MNSSNGYLPKIPEDDPRVKLRLFCLPFGGAGASIYRNWHHSLPKSVEVCPIQLPGREERHSEKPFTHTAPLVTELGQVLEPYLDRPFALFGHSMGALISFELTRHLRRQNQPMPVQLFLSGRPAPQVPALCPPTFQLPDLELIEELRRMQGTPEAVIQNPEMMELLLPLLRADFELCQTYHCQDEPPLDCPFFVFGGFDDADVPKENLIVWRTQTTYPMRLQMFSGDHFFVLSSQQELLHIVSQQLSQLIDDRCNL